MQALVGCIRRDGTRGKGAEGRGGERNEGEGSERCRNQKVYLPGVTATTRGWREE